MGLDLSILISLELTIRYVQSDKIGEIMDAKYYLNEIDKMIAQDERDEKIGHYVVLFFGGYSLNPLAKLMRRIAHSTLKADGRIGYYYWLQW
ncbi:MAG: hypothetical protein CMA07_07765 [Euryarchaeota archaeon]|nr:hypothetical protein [Euryarchaeota archaeon]